MSEASPNPLDRINVIDGKISGLQSGVDSLKYEIRQMNLLLAGAQKKLTSQDKVLKELKYDAVQISTAAGDANTRLAEALAAELSKIKRDAEEANTLIEKINNDAGEAAKEAKEAGKTAKKLMKEGENSDAKAIQLFGVFAALFSFISIEFKFIRDFQTIGFFMCFSLMILGVVLFIIASLDCFVMRRWQGILGMIVGATLLGLAILVGFRSIDDWNKSLTVTTNSIPNSIEVTVHQADGEPVASSPK